MLLRVSMLGAVLVTCGSVAVATDDRPAADAPASLRGDLDRVLAATPANDLVPVVALMRAAAPRADIDRLARGPNARTAVSTLLETTAAERCLSTPTERFGCEEPP